MLGVLISHIQTRCVLVVPIVPDINAPWFPLLKSALVRTKAVASMADPKGFFRVHHNRGTIPVIFQKWGTRSLDVVRG